MASFCCRMRAPVSLESAVGPKDDCSRRFYGLGIEHRASVRLHLGVACWLTGGSRSSWHWLLISAFRGSFFHAVHLMVTHICLLTESLTSPISRRRLHNKRKQTCLQISSSGFSRFWMTIACKAPPPLPPTCGNTAVYFLRATRALLLSWNPSPEVAERGWKPRNVSRCKGLEWRATAGCMAAWVPCGLTILLWHTTARSLPSMADEVKSIDLKSPLVEIRGKKSRPPTRSYNPYHILPTIERSSIQSVYSVNVFSQTGSVEVTRFSRRSKLTHNRDMRRFPPLPPPRRMKTLSFVTDLLSSSMERSFLYL